jgi:adenylate cyclase
VHDHVHDRLDLAFEQLGALSLKNIVRPVEAFVLRLDTETASTFVAEPIGPGKHEGMSLPDKPSLAVLAFTNMSGDPEQEYFSDGVAEDIITELSRSRSLFVIARNSSFTYRDHAVDVKQVGHELGVRYVVEGSVRRSGSRVRVWAERYDRDIEEVFAVQDEITVAILNAIIPVISGFEQQRALRRRPGNLGAWEAYQYGLWHMSKCTSSDNVRAQEFFDRAIALDAAFSSAHAAFAQSIMVRGVAYGNLPVGEATRIAIDRAREAVDIDTNDSDAQAILSFALWTSGDFEQAWVVIAASRSRRGSSDGSRGLASGRS